MSDTDIYISIECMTRSVIEFRNRTYLRNVR